MVSCKDCQCEIDSCICGDVDRFFAEDQDLTFEMYEEREGAQKLPKATYAEELESEEADDSF